MLTPRVGAPPLTITLPFLPTTEQVRLCTPPMADCTSPAERTFPSRDCGKLGARFMPLMLSFTIERPEI